MSTVTLNITTSMRWWFTPWKYCVLGYVLLTGHEPSDAWVNKWVRRAVRIEVKP